MDFLNPHTLDKDLQVLDLNILHTLSQFTATSTVVAEYTYQSLIEEVWRKV